MFEFIINQSKSLLEVVLYFIKYVICNFVQLQDVADRYQRPAAPSLGDFGEVLASATANNVNNENNTASGGGGGGGGPATGFVVKGGPWEQRAPDTASTHEFPTMPGATRAAAPPPAQSSPAAWGPRR